LRIATLAATGTLLVLAAWNLTLLLPQMHGLGSAIGVDFNLYMEAAARWLSGGSFYLDRQLAGPYEAQPGDILYRPSILLLLAPFRFLPAILWWVIPTLVIVGATWRVRPAWWSWPVLAFVLWYPRTQRMFLYGNTGIWVVAALAAATRWRAAATIALVKPSLGPRALFGARRRSWWIALGVLVLVSLGFAGLWRDYVVAVTRSDLGPLYSIQDLPPTLAPIIAWLARTRTDPR